MKTRTWCSSAANLGKLIAVVYNDSLPKRADAAYLFGEEPQNEDPVLTCGEKMLSENSVEQLFFPGSNGTSLNGNHYKWKRWDDRLIRFVRSRNDRDSVIHSIPIVSEGITFWHTHIEAGKLIEYAADQEIKTLFVTAVTTHQIRAFVETVWAVLTGCGGLLPKQDIRVWSNPPPRLSRSWHAPTVIAQTQAGGPKPMIDTIADELERIERYWAKGDLVTCEEVLEYLAWRDSE